MNFWYSLVLLTLGQIPLIIKLWLDHKAKKDAFRSLLFERQFSAFMEINRLLARLHACFSSFISLQGYLRVDPEQKEGMSEINKSLGKAYMEWVGALEQLGF